LHSVFAAHVKTTRITGEQSMIDFGSDDEAVDDEQDRPNRKQRHRGWHDAADWRGAEFRHDGISDNAINAKTDAADRCNDRPNDQAARPNIAEPRCDEEREGSANRNQGTKNQAVGGRPRLVVEGLIKDEQGQALNEADSQSYQG